MGVRFPHALTALSLSAIIVAASCAEAKRPDSFSFELPAQSLAVSLNAVAARGRITIAAPAILLDGKTASALSGQMTVTEAVDRLLRGTGLHASEAGDAIIVAPGQTERDAATSDADVVITGTRIRGQAPAGAELITIDRAAIDASGYATTQQILQSLPQNFGGGVNESTAGFTDRNGAGTNTSGASSINLRGLGVGSTLVLIDGNRPALGGGNAAVDIGMIPSNAIERIEILPDGASALYGSDAVAGVVNIRLRNNFRGAETRFRQAFGNAFAETQLSQIFGAGWSSGHLAVGYEFYRRGRLAAADRRYASEDLRPFGGPDLREGYANPGTIIAANGQTFAIPAGQDGTHLVPSQLLAGQVNLADARAETDLLPSVRRHTAFFNLEQNVASNVRLVLRGLYGERHATQRLLPTPRDSRVPVTNPFYVDPIGTGQPVVVDYDFQKDLGPATGRSYVRDASLEGGLVASFGAWSVDVHGNYGTDWERGRTENRVNGYYLNQALADTDPSTAYNLFGDGTHTNPRTIDRIRGWGRAAGLSHIWSGSVKADGPLFSLPAGAARLAVGGEYRREHYSYDDIIFVSSAAPVDDGGAGYPLGRSIGAGYAELFLPLVDPTMGVPAIRSLSLALAERVEHYSDEGTTSNPRIGLTWKPIDRLSVRASYGTSFRAPDLGSKRLGAADGFTQQAPLPLPDPASPTGTTYALGLFGNNPAIGPERARTWTAGLDLQPRGDRGLTANLTYFSIAYRDRISNPAIDVFVFLQQRARYAALINDHPDPAVIAAYYASDSLINPFGIDASKISTIIDARIANLARQSETGLDFNVGYTFGAAPVRFEIGVSGTYLFKLDQRLVDGATSTSVVSTIGFPVDLRVRGRALATLGRFDVATFANFTNHYRNTAVTPADKVHSWTAIDAQVGYRLGGAHGPLKGVALSLSATNLFNRKPPYALVQTLASASGYDPENASPLGRVIAFQVTKPW